MGWFRRAAGAGRAARYRESLEIQRNQQCIAINSVETNVGGVRYPLRACAIHTRIPNTVQNALLQAIPQRALTAILGVAMFGASSASRRYTGTDGHDVQVRITGDSAMVMQFAQIFMNPAIAGAMGKLIRVGDQRAIQTNEGSINMVVANKFLITVDGSADAAAKLAYAQAVDVAKLSKM